MVQRTCPCGLSGLICLILIALSSNAAAQQFDPQYRFRTRSTEHFVIYFHQGEDRLAARLAGIAEATWEALSQQFGTPLPARTHVVLVDQAELSNGYATPLPRNTIALYAVWPSGSDLLRADDWLKVVFTHEFTHIVHLDRSEGWARVVRGIFGRAPLAFPNMFLPTWQTEGLATYEESVVTGEGRLHAGNFRAIVDEAARGRRLEPLDRVNGGLTDWPGGLAPYAYGLGFHAYLAERYGAGKFAALSTRTARSLPYFSSPGFRAVYGKSLGELWREYQDSVSRATVAASTGTTTQLTHHRFVASGPRFAPRACASCPLDLYYSIRNADEFPALYRLRLDGSAPTRVTTRFLGSTIGPGREQVYFDQLEIRRNAGLYGDLYALSRATGEVNRLTSDARIADPDLSPDGKTLVAVRNSPGQRDLVLVRLDRPETAPVVTTLLAAADTQFNAPRWSPDGRSVGVERHQLGGQIDIVIVDVSSRTARVVSSSSGMRWATPTWRRDGRALVAAGAIGDGPFNLFEIEVETGRRRQLTRTTGGATWPEVSPDGHSIVYVGYTVEGSDLFEMRYPVQASEESARGPREDSESSSAGARASGGGAPRAQINDDSVGGPRESEPVDGRRNSGFSQGPTSFPNYSPWATFAPTSWSPIVETAPDELRVGGSVAAGDVLGYHSAAVSVTGTVSRPQGVAPDTGSIVDWMTAYNYSRYRPLIFASASRETSFFDGAPSEEGLAVTATRREQKTEAGILFRVSHARTTGTVTSSFARAIDTEILPDGERSTNRSSARASGSFTTARSYDNSVSFERGAAIGATATLVRAAFGATGSATTVTGDSRVYLPGLAAHHVLAIRLAGAASTGDRSVGRTFLLGGGDSNVDLTSFDSNAVSLLRGFATNTFAGTHVALLNADYRFPLARVERGIGTWPAFFHTAHAAVAMDIGHAWTDRFARSDLKRSVAAELSCDFVAGYNVRLTATVGAAYGHDGSHAATGGARIYARINRAF
jgi:Tol biopolymer transport system component